MRGTLVAAAVGMMLTGPLAAQSLNDVGRLLQDQLLPGQQRQPDPAQQQREREIYEQGRRDQEEARREERLRRQDTNRRDDRDGYERRPGDSRFDERGNDARPRGDERRLSEQERNRRERQRLRDENERDYPEQRGNRP